MAVCVSVAYELAQPRQGMR